MCLIPVYSLSILPIHSRLFSLQITSQVHHYASGVRAGLSALPTQGMIYMSHLQSFCLSTIHLHSGGSPAATKRGLDILIQEYSTANAPWLPGLNALFQLDSALRVPVYATILLRKALFIQFNRNKVKSLKPSWIVNPLFQQPPALVWLK